MVTAQVTVGILQHINVSYQQVVHAKLAQCYLSIMYLSHSLKTGGVGGGGVEFSQCSEPSFKYQQPPLLTSGYLRAPGHYLMSAGSFWHFVNNLLVVIHERVGPKIATPLLSDHNCNT